MAVYGFRDNKLIVDELDIRGTLELTGRPTFTEGDFTATTGVISGTAASDAKLTIWANGTTYYIPLHK